MAFKVIIIVVSVCLMLVIAVVGERKVINVSEYQCGENGQIKRTMANAIKIILPKNCQAFYSVNAERIENCTNQQRCTLMTWQIIRNLEKFLNEEYKNTGKDGLVEFDHTLIIPDFNYLLHVTLKNHEGKISAEDFLITFTDNYIPKHTRDIVGTLDMIIGSDYVYTSSPLIINADLRLCGNLMNYFFRWSISTSTKHILLPEKGSRLTIIADSLELVKNETCIIHCLVLNIENNSTILEGSKKINIRYPPDRLNSINIILPFKSTTVNTRSPIYIMPYIRSLEDYKIAWSCMYENVLLYACQKQINEEFYLENGFSLEGSYTVSLKVFNGLLESSATCNIIVSTDVSSIEFYMEHPIRPEKEIEIKAKVYDLRTYCTVQWRSDDLKHIPGFTEDVYNISSKDKLFLEEIVDFGKMKISKEFKLKIPPPSRTWSGLNSKVYDLEILVSCPSIDEINDNSVLKSFPESIVTINAHTELFVPNHPRVKSLRVLCDDDANEALKSIFTFKIDAADSTDEPMVYKYGIVLENMELIFYSAINILSAKTILPFNGDDGVDVFVEVCNYENQCGRTFGPAVITKLYQDLDERAVRKTFRQMLIEQDYYKAFSYALTVLHSVKFSETDDQFEHAFSTEISIEVRTFTNLSEEINVQVFTSFVKNLAIFVNNLFLSDELMTEISVLIKESSNKALIGIRSKRDSISAHNPSILEDNIAKLEEMKNFLITSEYLVNSCLKTGVDCKEKEHFMNLLDGWMVLACNMLFNGQQVYNIEMKSVIFTIEKITQKIQNNIITIPYEENGWNNHAKLRLTDIKDFGANKLCLGKTMLKEFFNLTGTIFGANIYKGDDQSSEEVTLTDIEVFLPIDEDISRAKQPKCFVYKNGIVISCSVVRQLKHFVQCSCQVFGYFFVEYISMPMEMEGRVIAIFKNMSQEKVNISNDYTSDDEYYGDVQLGKKISYVIIFSSLIGFIILFYIIRKLTIFPQQNIGLDGFHDNVHYGHVMNEELLE